MFSLASSFAKARATMHIQWINSIAYIEAWLATDYKKYLQLDYTTF